MSASGANRVETGTTLDDLPQFTLDFELDDPLEPSTVTVYEPGPDAITTHWLSADVDHAVDLADIA